MRKQLVTTVENIMDMDKTVTLLLGDIGVFGFRNAFSNYAERVFNIGILEQSTVGVAAGMAIEGLIPIVHTIAPFLIERSLEQLKIDFCYQNLGGNFIGIGGSYDYAALGCTHHCPGDVGILKNLPQMEIVVPGTSSEFHQLFSKVYSNGKPTYFRLSERENQIGFDVEFGKAFVCKKGKKATIIAVGPMLAPVLEAIGDLDVTILYYTTVVPFDVETLRNHISGSRVVLCEPYYTGALAGDILKALYPTPITLCTIGVPVKFLTNYGSTEQHDFKLGLTPQYIRKETEDLILA